MKSRTLDKIISLFSFYVQDRRYEVMLLESQSVLGNLRPQSIFLMYFTTGVTVQSKQEGFSCSGVENIVSGINAQKINSSHNKILSIVPEQRYNVTTYGIMSPS